MACSPWSEGKFWFWRQKERVKISAIREATPTKIGLHAFQINLYLHEFFEPILFFETHGLKRNFGRFWKEQYLLNRRGDTHQN